MKIDLDELERKAQVAHEAAPYSWEAKPYTPLSGRLLPGPITRPNYRVQQVSQASQICFADHIVAMQPPVTLALIARIRELETLAADLLAEYVKGGDVDRLPGAAQYAILEKGAVLP